VAGCPTLRAFRRVGIPSAEGALPPRWYFRNPFFPNSLGARISPANTYRMRRVSTLTALLFCGFVAIASAQDNRVFDWTPANDSQTLLILPDITFSGHKKAGVEVNTVKCVDHCDLLPPPPTL
jgi:hypothetical protein